jgi:adenylate kinase
MRLILLGPPGSGKGTQAKLLSERLGLLHFSTGDILREAVAKDTAEGRRAKSYMTAGQLVPDELVNEIVNARFRRSDKPTRFVMDGYPRTHAQALVFDKVLAEQGLDVGRVVYLTVADEEIVQRLGNRWTCPNSACKAIYHTVANPPKAAGICDKCQTPLYQREDDKPATIRKRLEVFHQANNDLVRHYRDRGLLVEVPGRGDIEAIHGAIVTALK